MEGIRITENSESVVLLLDKSVYSKEEIANALTWLRQTNERDTSHLDPISDDEQAEWDTLLNSMSPEDKAIAFVREVKR